MKGLFSFFLFDTFQKCDLVIGPLVMTIKRLLNMDFAEGYAYTNVVIIIPMPESSDNSAAIAYPFQMQVFNLILIITPVAFQIIADTCIRFGSRCYYPCR